MILTIGYAGNAVNGRVLTVQSDRSYVRWIRYGEGSGKDVLSVLRIARYLAIGGDDDFYVVIAPTITSGRGTMRPFLITLIVAKVGSENALQRYAMIQIALYSGSSRVLVIAPAGKITQSGSTASMKHRELALLAPWCGAMMTSDCRGTSGALSTMYFSGPTVLVPIISATNGIAGEQNGTTGINQTNHNADGVVHFALVEKGNTQSEGGSLNPDTNTSELSP